MVVRMNYLFYGLETFLMEKEIKKILSQANVEDYSISKYDLESNLIDDIIEDASMISLFNDQKVILVDNAYIFTRKVVKNPLNHDLKKLEEYLNHPNPSTILIFSIEYEKIDSVKKITKSIKKNGVVKEFNKNTQMTSIVKEMLGEYTMSPQDLSFFIERVGNQLLILEQELIKIKNYKLDDHHITREDIITLTHKNIDVDIFALIEAIVSKNKEKAMEIYSEMIKRNEEPIKIIVMLANQFRIIYQAKELYKMGYTGDNIATKLGIHPYRIKLALASANKYSSNVLLKAINDLAELDLNIKSGKCDKTLGLELFILGL